MNLRTFLALALLAACSSPSTRAWPTCTPKTTQECSCCGGSYAGHQTCNADGTGWAACQCGDINNTNCPPLPEQDAGHNTFDAGPGIDAGPADAGQPDAGPEDAGVSDFDAGPVVDAGNACLNACSDDYHACVSDTLQWCYQHGGCGTSSTPNYSYCISQCVTNHDGPCTSDKATCESHC